MSVLNANRAGTGRAGVVVVGGSIAATTAAATLRSEGYDGPVTLLCQERHPPYARPPLSKAFLAGLDDPGGTAIPLDGLDLAIRTQARATRLDLQRRRVIINEDEDIPYDGLIIATGARARTMTAIDPADPRDDGELVLRSLTDAQGIAASLRERPSVLIIGAGVLGFELASACRALGVEVTMVDVAQPLVGQLGSALAEILVCRAREAGVRFVVSPSGVTRRSDGSHTYVQLADGTRLHADVVVTSVGCLPNVEWLEGSGLPTSGGLVVDDRCRVAPGIVAAGDLTRVQTAGGDPGRRTPNWTDAINQARVAASALLHGDQAAPYTRDPYFWTEAFGLSVKVAGTLPPRGPAEVLAEGPDGATGDRLLQWVEDGRPVAAAAINHRIPVIKLKKLSRTPA